MDTDTLPGHLDTKWHKKGRDDYALERKGEAVISGQSQRGRRGAN